jgi:IS30 family transposase
MRQKPNSKIGGKREPIPLKERQGMRALKALGFSCREIGKLFGRARSLVQTNVGKGWEEREAKRGQPRPHQYNERWYRWKARKVYQAHHRVKLTRDQHVHHIDHDFTNFGVENLTVMNASEHSKHHHPKNPTPRWLRPERKVYQQSYMKTIRVQRICVRCGAKFTTTKYQTGLCCSTRCYLLGRPRGQKQA